MNSTNAMNETSSGKPTISKTSDIKLSASPETDQSGVSAELDKKKSTNGKTGLSTTTIKLRKTGIGEFRLKPFLESPLRNKQALEKIIKRLDTGTWVKCPKCAEEWNRLTPNGICYNCDPVEQEDRRRYYA